jgi:hypothetical protein
MGYQGAISAVAVAAAMAVSLSAARAEDYPDWSGQWVRDGNPNWVQAGGKAPLTPEYEKVYDEVKADLASGGVGNLPSTFCIPQGMPMMMNLYDPMELVITPKTTYLLISHVNDSYRRIYTDGRQFPADPELTYAGYSIGKWKDTKGDGHPAGPSSFDMYDEVLRHHRRYRLPELEKRVRDLGFRVEKATHLGFLLYPLFKLAKLRNRYIGRHLDSDRKQALVAQQIGRTAGSRWMRAALALEYKLGKRASFPFGIRCILRLRKQG